MLAGSIEHKHDFSYYEHFRPSILEQVPATAKCVLSVGCAAGVTESELVNRGVKVIGIEIDHEAAALARQRGLTVLEGDVSTIDVSQVCESFDCLVYADVLEHLPDPLTVLQRHVERLKSDGTVIVTVPNFRHYSVLWQLFVLGRVRYKQAGILDRTHLRITTRRMVTEWFDQVGLEPVFCSYQISRRRDKLISSVSFRSLREFLGSQILVVGKKTQNRNQTCSVRKLQKELTR